MALTTATTPRDRSAEFYALQIKAKIAHSDMSQLRIHAKVRYSDVAYAPAKLKRQIDVATRKADRAWARLFKLVETISPRDWSSRVPVSWIRDQLTYSDAITHGQLSMIPPPAWGYTEAELKEFARVAGRPQACV
jgi:hypothetical protein